MGAGSPPTPLESVSDERPRSARRFKSASVLARLRASTAGRAAVPRRRSWRSSTRSWWRSGTCSRPAAPTRTSDSTTSSAATRSDASATTSTSFARWASSRDQGSRVVPAEGPRPVRLANSRRAGTAVAVWAYGLDRMTTFMVLGRLWYCMEILRRILAS